MTQRIFAMPAANGDKTIVTVSAGASIGTDVVRVHLDDANATNRQLVLDALLLIRARIIEAAWPLA